MNTAIETNPGTEKSDSVIELDAVIIGSGVAGLYQLYRLREQGLKVKALEGGSDVGGTWNWNRYPGARLDSPSHVYQYWFSKELNDEWSWSERFPAAPEIKKYFEFVADRFDLRKDIQFNTWVTAATYDEAAKRWTITTDSGQTFQAQFFISCAGMISAPLIPKFPGQDQFKGRIFHTARWPAEVDFKGKRVAVIGTAATGIQVIQSLAPEVAQLTVFQKSPEFTIPMNNYTLTDADRQSFRKRFNELRHRVMRTNAGFDFDFMYGKWADLTKEERRQVLEEVWADGSLAFWVGAFPEVLVDQHANDEITAFVQEKTRARIKDPKLAEKLIPKNFGFGAKRVPLENRYYEVYERGNVELVDVNETPIECLTEHGIQTSDGKLREIDILVLATGFDAGTGALTRIDIRGRSGRSLKEEWGKEIRTTLGLQVYGYPNFFTTGAPLAPAAALCNMPTCLQHQVDWIAGCINFLKAQGLREIEPSEQMENDWVSYHDGFANATLMSKTDSWYMGSN
uniref:flavin-containing monooxygenase n=1 Tax=Burkholderia cepacia TaxID=292 RepID=UPI002AB77A95